MNLPKFKEANWPRVGSMEWNYWRQENWDGWNLDDFRRDGRVTPDEFIGKQSRYISRGRNVGDGSSMCFWELRVEDLIQGIGVWNSWREKGWHDDGSVWGYKFSREMTHLYAIAAVGSDAVKVGMSTQPRKRLHGIRHGSAQGVELLFAVPVPKKINDDHPDKFVHALGGLHGWLNGEWFRQGSLVVWIAEQVRDEMEDYDWSVFNSREK